MRTLPMCVTIIFLAAVAVAVIAQQAPHNAAGDLKVVKELKIGGEGRWDYLTIDVQTKRLYVPRSDRVMVIDAEEGKTLATIPQTSGVHGVALAGELGRAFSSNGAENTVSVFDTKSLSVICKVKVGEKPDAIIYDPASKKVFSLNGKSNDASAFDAAVGDQQISEVTTILLGGAPEFAVADGQGHVYVNIEDKNEIVQIDSKTLKVTAHWPLDLGQEPTGLAMDCEHRLLFSGCHNKLLVVMNADTGKVVASLPIGQGVDACGFDPKLGLVFASCGDGTLAVIKEETTEKFTVIQNVQTRKGARTMALDPVTHRIYLATAEFGPAPADQPRKAPMLADSFTILVVDK